jgi:hypothetical protein
MAADKVSVSCPAKNSSVAECSWIIFDIDLELSNNLSDELVDCVIMLDRLRMWLRNLNLHGGVGGAVPSNSA